MISSAQVRPRCVQNFLLLITMRAVPLLSSSVFVWDRVTPAWWSRHPHGCKNPYSGNPSDRDRQVVLCILFIKQYMDTVYVRLAHQRLVAKDDRELALLRQPLHNSPVSRERGVVDVDAKPCPPPQHPPPQSISGPSPPRVNDSTI